MRMTNEAMDAGEEPSTVEKLAIEHIVTPSRLLDLPPEIRNQICTLAVTATVSLLVPATCDHVGWQDAAQPAITRVNRQIRKEALPIFYCENIFEAHVHSLDFGYFLSFMQIIGPQNIRNMRNVKVSTPADSSIMDCAVGLLDFVRWCATNQDCEEITVWQGTSHIDDNLVLDALGLALSCYEKRKTFEMQLRAEFSAWLTENDLQCSCDNDSPTCSSNRVRTSATHACDLSPENSLDLVTPDEWEVKMK
ncbi:hypothetical protein LTR10_002725 [Elasticomyces elasticus]|nr:hypothetical protein LTR10_002725 [Elasticomyces elasticus]KAK4967935.1 hypothetical protein LTR42_010263 [Elasticomyces elasticus]